jgi:SAM-dependent methyltransferase
MQISTDQKVEPSNFRRCGVRSRQADDKVCLMDWGVGHYEHLAEVLRPAAEVVVGQLAPRPDEVVLDLGCGTGNAASIAASRGARVTGVDPSPRLLDVARADAAAAGLDIAFSIGDAASLPVPDGSADAIVSVFGVIFAPDAQAAAAEMARVLRPGGRLVFSAWLREGALAGQARMRARLIAGVLGEDLAADCSPGTIQRRWRSCSRRTDSL